MAWDHLAINKPHLVYIILGGFTSLFMLCSSFIKERLYIGEATVATIAGLIFGPHAAGLIDPFSWGNTDQITLEFSRIVLVVQCFAVGVELPKYYMEKHWRSVVFLLVPVMTFGWLMTSLFIWWMIPPLDWLESLCVAACVTATDPVLASSVVGKGKFAKRIPKHLRDVLSAESGCNDGMAFPFIYLALYIIHYQYEPNEVAMHWFAITILYECIFGAIYGFTIGYIGRHGIKYAEKHDLVDRESFLVFYFVLALFCAGSGSILGVDDLLVGFAAGVGFSNDGWFTQKTEESHVSNVIDLLLNLAYFVYLGTIIPWEQYNNVDLGVTPWRLVVIAIFVILFRRIPIMMLLKPVIPDIKTWREALFAGHFGPIGVGAIFVAILARADLETDGQSTPLAQLPGPDAPFYNLIALIWPITTFLVISSIIVHGSSIAVFTLGKHINTLTLTMSYTTANEEGPSWMSRLPRISSQSRSMTKASERSSETDDEDARMENLPPGFLPPISLPREFLRRQKEDDNSSRQSSRASSLNRRRKRKKRDSAGGPVSLSAITPALRLYNEETSTTLTPHDGDGENELGEVQDDHVMHAIIHRHEEEEKKDEHKSDAERHPEQTETYVEGDHLVTENADGDVLTVQQTPSRVRKSHNIDETHAAQTEKKDDHEERSYSYHNLRKKLGVWRHRDDPDYEGESGMKKETERKRGPALAYQFGNTIIVEDQDGEVVKKYELPPQIDKESGPLRQGIARMGTWTGKRKEGEDLEDQNPNPAGTVRHGLSRMTTWTGLGGKKEESSSGATPPKSRKTVEDEDDDDRRIRFTIGGSGRRMTKEDFLKEMRQLDPKARAQVVNESDAPEALKDLARKDASDYTKGSDRLFSARAPQLGNSSRTAEKVAATMANMGTNVDPDFEAEEMEKEESELYRKTSPRSAADPHKLSESDEEKPQRPVSRQAGRETPAERRRQQALSSAQGAQSPSGETPAERRRREAALGLAGDGNAANEEEDSDDDNTERVPQRSRGIRFAEDPIRGRKQ